MAFTLTAAHYEQLQRDLTTFLGQSEASAVLLCDRGGNIIISAGEPVTGTGALDLVAALVAGSFAATKELAGVLGEKEFNCIFHEGTHLSIFISAVGPEVLLLALFSENTTAGLVKMYALNAIRKIAGSFDEIMAQREVGAVDPTVSFVLSKGPIFAQQ